MLYQLYEAQRAFTSPFSDFASATAKLFGNAQTPMGPLPFGQSITQRIAAAWDLAHRLTKKYDRPQFNIHSAEPDGMPGKTMAVQEQVIMTKPFCRLLRFKRFTDDAQVLSQIKNHPTILVAAPLSGHYSTLLRDTVRTLLGGHKVYITDWSDARTTSLEQGLFTLNDYVAYIEEFIRHIHQQALATGQNGCHVISVCQPTVPVLAAVSLMAARGEPIPLSLTMMGGPIDARKSPTSVNTLALTRSLSWFENYVICRVPQQYPGAGRRVYPGFLQHAGFVAMNPQHHSQSHWDYFLHLVEGDDDNAESHRAFYDEYNATLDIDAEFYLDTIHTVFQEFLLVKGGWIKDGEEVRPSSIHTTHLLTIEGEKDDISGAGQTQAAHDLCYGIPAEHRSHYIVPQAGHYGIFSGRRWRELVYPHARDFIAKANQSTTYSAAKN